MNKEKQSISIVGSGVTGLSAAWLLRDKYEVTLFEKNDYLGGHTHTHDVVENNKELAIDSGIIVYNEKNYPNLVGLFEELEVETQATDMSFAFSMNQGELEYA
jgi:predicted NAD/FAD-binding protein